MTADYEITIRARNNRILSRIRAAGYQSIPAFCERNSIRYSEINAIIAMKKAAKLKTGEWRKSVYDLSAALKCMPDDLFTERQAGGGVTPIIRNVGEDELVALSDLRNEPAGVCGPDKVIEMRETMDILKSALRPREKMIIEEYMGGKTCEEIGAALGIHRARVDQILHKCIYRMRSRAYLAGMISEKPNQADKARLLDLQ